MAWRVKSNQNSTSPTKWRVKSNQNSVQPKQWRAKTSSSPRSNQPKPSKIGGAFRWTTDQLIKPVSSATNLLEDTGKTIGYGIGKAFGGVPTAVGSSP